MLKRLLNLLKALITAGPKELEDPERLLKKAQAKMRQKQASKRERAVQAVAARNHLQQQVNDTRRRIYKLTDKINAAERRGDNEEAQNLRQKRDDYQETLVALKQQLARAIELSEQVMQAVKREIAREEEKKLQKLRDALELKSQWQSAQMGDVDNVPLQIDPVMKWVLVLILLCLLGLVILRIVG